MKFFTVLVFTLLLIGAHSAKLYNEKFYNTLAKLECLPSGFPCVPSLNSTSEGTTTSSPADDDDIGESTTTNLPLGKERNSPPTCCTKCLYETGWIDAVCE
ncbi:hypothetical protein Ocin01_05906 [Orchesella cincta]|uniref:Secreted protein n=1 Tax=Orchesella cincta TaxID=48709 RepID=A0A1D2N6Q9_ORCCI|nr:hypothetical protein Ocin01_05906 [Orchesella cincta]